MFKVVAYDILAAIARYYLKSSLPVIALALTFFNPQYNSAGLKKKQLRTLIPIQADYTLTLSPITTVYYLAKLLLSPEEPNRLSN